MQKTTQFSRTDAERSRNPAEETSLQERLPHAVQVKRAQKRPMLGQAVPSRNARA
jgi:hypothetical protein